MTIENETMLEEVIKNNFEMLKTMDVDSDEYEDAVDAQMRLVDRAIKLSQIDIEIEKANQENLAKLKEMEDENKREKTRNIIKIAMFGVATVVTIWANIDSKRFEQGFTHTTASGRESQRKLLSFMDKVGRL